MQFFRQHAVADYFEGGFDGAGELLMLVHGQVTPAQAALFNERLQRLAQDFSQQHLGNQKLPSTEKQAFTVLVGMRSWLFAPFREQLREPPETGTTALAAMPLPSTVVRAGKRGTLRG
jgi:hypothetical protein